MNKLNEPHRSKINITAILTLLATLLTTWWITDPELKSKIITTAGVIGPLLTIVFRTWFTGNTDYQPPDRTWDDNYSGDNYIKDEDNPHDIY